MRLDSIAGQCDMIKIHPYIVYIWSNLPSYLSCTHCSIHELIVFSIAYWEVDVE